MPPPPDSAAASRGPAPSSVTNAVRLMYLSAVLGVVGLKEDQPKLTGSEDRYRRQHRARHRGRPRDRLHHPLAVLASFVGKGRNWARIVTWILAGIGVLSLAFVPTQDPVSILIASIGGIIDIVIIVLLAIKPSSEYFSPKPSL